MWGMTFEKSLRMFSPRMSQEECDCHKRIAADTRECLRLLLLIKAKLDEKGANST
jgi:hypothetical protein